MKFRFLALSKMIMFGLLQCNSPLQCKQPEYLDMLIVLIPFTWSSKLLFNYIETSRKTLGIRVEEQAGIPIPPQSDCCFFAF